MSALATCRGCGIGLNGTPYHLGGVARHPVTREDCRVNHYGGWVCSEDCDRRASIEHERTMPGASVRCRRGIAASQLVRRQGGGQVIDAIRAARKELLRQLSACPWPQPGYVIGSEDTDDHVTHDYAFCEEHATMAARGDRIMTGFEMHILNVSHGESDHEEWCAFHGCSEPLNTGSPTDAWIDSALGLTESDPYAVIVTPYELVRSECNMLDDDERWPVWIRQARKAVLRLQRAARAKRGG